MIQREIQPVIEQNLFKGKVIVLKGARQVGKTSLIHQIASNVKEPALTLNCVDSEVRSSLTKTNIKQLQKMIGKHRLVIMDDVQRLKNIELTLKLMIDACPNVQFILSGSLSPHLNFEINKILAGKKLEYHLYPLSSNELTTINDVQTIGQALEKYMIYGAYPDVINVPGNEKECLTNLVNKYLYKGVFALNDIRKPSQLENLVMALAQQTGSEVSFHQLAQTIGADNQTVERYIDLLEHSFIVFRLDSLSRGNRSFEIKKGKKVYFFDNGIRNAILQDFSPLDIRQDIESLWENYILSERLKANHYRNFTPQRYFWRTFQNQQIDFIEEANDLFTAFQIQWDEKRNLRIPKTFTKSYPLQQYHIINKTNYLDFLK